MQQAEDEPIETLHVYVMRGAAPTPSSLSLLPPAVALSLAVALMTICLSVPSQQLVTRAVIRVPAVPLAVRTFTADVPIIPTGLKTYPATTAHGILTITNGSIIAQILPSGFTDVSGDDISVVTDRTVFVPAGSANGYGYATVNAHAENAGKNGNIPALAINSVVGSSFYIRNLSAFSGGRDSYSVHIVTAQDSSAAITKARNMLLSVSMGLHYPCRETVKMSRAMVSIQWRCQLVMYHLSAMYHVTAVRLSGTYLFISVWCVPRPKYIWVR